MGISRLAERHQKSFGYHLEQLRKEADLTHEQLSDQIRTQVSGADEDHRQQQAEEIERSLKAITAQEIRAWENNRSLPEKDVVPVLADILIKADGADHTAKRENFLRAYEESAAKAQSGADAGGAFGEALVNLMDEARLSRPQLAELLVESLRETRKATITGRPLDLHVTDDEGSRITYDRNLKPTHLNGADISGLDQSLQDIATMPATALMTHTEINGLPSEHLQDSLVSVLKARGHNTDSLEARYAQGVAARRTESAPAEAADPHPNAWQEKVVPTLTTTSRVNGHASRMNGSAHQSDLEMPIDPVRDIAFTSVALAAYLTGSGNTDAVANARQYRSGIDLPKEDLTRLAKVIEFNEPVPHALRERLLDNKRVERLGAATLTTLLYVRDAAIERLRTDLESTSDYAAVNIAGEELLQQLAKSNITLAEVTKVARDNKQIFNITPAGETDLSELFEHGAKPSREFNVNLLLDEIQAYAKKARKPYSGHDLEHALKIFKTHFATYDALHERKLREIKAQTAEFESVYANIKGSPMGQAMPGVSSTEQQSEVMEAFFNTAKMESRLPALTERSGQQQHWV